MAAAPERRAAQSAASASAAAAAAAAAMSRRRVIRAPRMRCDGNDDNQLNGNLRRRLSAGQRLLLKWLGAAAFGGTCSGVCFASSSPSSSGDEIALNVNRLVAAAAARKQNAAAAAAAQQKSKDQKEDLVGVVASRRSERSWPRGGSGIRFARSLALVST